MTKQELKYLVDIQLCIEDLENYFLNEKNFTQFNNNIILKRALERVYEIIGEALKNYKNFERCERFFELKLLRFALTRKHKGHQVV